MPETPPQPISIDLSLISAHTRSLIQNTILNVNKIKMDSGFKVLVPGELSHVANMILDAIDGFQPKEPERITGVSAKDYKGVESLKEYITYKPKKDPDWKKCIKIAQFLLTTKSVPSLTINNWAFYFSSFLFDYKTPEKVIYHLGNIPELYEDGKTYADVEMPSLPPGYDEASFNCNGIDDQGYADLVDLKETAAPYVIPLIFATILRKNLCVSGSNFNNRLSKISDLISIYGFDPFHIAFPQNHYLRSLVPAGRGGLSANTAKDRDFLAKMLMLRISKNDHPLARIGLGLIVQNTLFFGLSHYLCFTRVLKSIGINKGNELLGVINQANHQDQTVRFMNLLSITKRFKDDSVWYCVKALNNGFFLAHSPRGNPDFTMNIAYLDSKINLSDNNNPYMNYKAMDPNVFKPLSAARINFLNKALGRWGLNEKSANEGSLLPPIMDGHEQQQEDMDDVASDDIGTMPN